MTVLLDTQVYLWFLADSSRLTSEARRKIQAASQVLVSAASIWEASLKIGLRKLDWRIQDIVAGITASGFSELPVRSSHAARLVELPGIHRDPFDRLLVAQAIDEHAELVTADGLLAGYGRQVVVLG